jgi:hypothetical protein
VRRDLSSEQWRTIKKVLPLHIDRARVRSELERVLRLRAGLPPEQQRFLQKLGRYLEIAPPLPVEPAALDGLKQACAGAIRRPRLFSIQRGIIWAFDSAGGDCRIVTPHKRKDEACWPEPTGAVVDYFRAASTAILGKSPGAERIKAIVRLYHAEVFLAFDFAGASGMSVKAELFDDAGRPVLVDKDRAKAVGLFFPRILPA